MKMKWNTYEQPTGQTSLHKLGHPTLLSDTWLCSYSQSAFYFLLVGCI